MSRPEPLSSLLEEVQTGFACGDSDNDGVAQIRMNNVDVDGRLRLDSVRRVPKHLADLAKFGLVDGDILFNNTNSPELVGKTALFTGAQEPFVFSNHFTRLRVNRKRVDPRYVARWLAKERNRGVFSRLCNQWVNQASVRKEALLALEVPLPETLEEQRRIADILDKADAIRRKRKEAIALTEELLRSAFLEMFGDPVTNPKGWPVEPLGKYLGFVTSGSRGWAEHYSEHGDRFIRSLDVQMDRIADEDAAYVVAPTGAEADRTRVQEEDVLLTITGSKIGRAARAMRSHAGAFISQHVAILRVLPGLDADVLAAFLVSDRGGQSLIARSQYGQTKPGLNLAQIRAFPIAVPPPQVQREIRRIRQQIRTSQSRFVDSLQTSDDLFNALVARAFSGDLAS